MIDIHCHLQLQDNPLPLPNSQNRFLCCGTHPQDWDYVLSLQSTPQINIALGLHPWYLNEQENWEALLEYHLQENPSLHIGECGLDFSSKWKASFPPALQIQVLERHMQLANSYNRPISLHNVKASGAMLSLIHKHKPDSFLLHSFQGSLESALEFEKMGAIFSFGKALFKSAKVQKLAQNLQKVLYESDACSYLNHQEHYLLWLNTLATLKKQPILVLQQQIEQNSLAFLDF